MQNRTGRNGQEEKYRQNSTDRTGQTEQGRQDRTGKAGWDSLDRIWQPEKDN
jgi:hypothetical protein